MDGACSLTRSPPRQTPGLFSGGRESAARTVWKWLGMYADHYSPDSNSGCSPRSVG